VNGGELERLALSVGYKASNISRRMREAYEDGLIERRMEGKSVAYRSLTPLHKTDIWRTNPISGERELLKTIYE
jgi:DNA-binding transcriptional ArsR family regulator